MSFPSVAGELRKRGLSPNALTPADIELAQEALLAAVKKDCRAAVKFLHGLAHKAKDVPEGVEWKRNPNSKIGKQLIRIHASDAVRHLVMEHVCHGQRLTFVNCCGGKVGGQKPKDDEVLIFQIQSQAGPIAYSDC